MRKSLTRAINEAVDDRERLATVPAPPVDGLDVVTAGTTITTDIPDLGELTDRELVAAPEVSAPVGEGPPVSPEAEPEDVTEALRDPDWEKELEKRERYGEDPEEVEAHGGMAKPGKMPCITYSMLSGGILDPETVDRLAAQGYDREELQRARGTCPHGTKLARIPGTVCYGCYASGGNYLRPNVINALARRAKATRSALEDPRKTERWVDAVASSIERSGNSYFRWHDSGDIMGPRHLGAIVEVARRKPDVMFWLPTKEHGTVRDWVRTHGAAKLPRNLNVRLSAHMLFDRMHAEPPLTSSSVASGEGFACPATGDPVWQRRYAFGSGNRRSATCGPCRACWDRGTANVDYAFHGATYRYRQGLLVHGLLEPRKGTVPEKPAGWEPAPPAQARAMELPREPGPVRKIIRPPD